jgi:hypothetical protein
VSPLDVISIADHPRVDPEKPLLIVDVDEVLALFMHGFAGFLEPRGYELRFDRFALFQNIYFPGATEHLDLIEGRTLFDDFFRFGCEDMLAVPNAAESLRRLAEAGVSVVILTNAPEHAREPRARWLMTHGMDYPLIINQGPKGEAVKALSEQTSKPAAFVDDLLSNLDSAAEIAPAVHRFQLVADERLRPLAPTTPDKHRRIDHWPPLREAIAKALGVMA